MGRTTKSTRSYGEVLYRLIEILSVIMITVETAARVGEESWSVILGFRSLGTPLRLGQAGFWQNRPKSGAPTVSSWTFIPRRAANRSIAYLKVLTFPTSAQHIQSNKLHPSWGIEAGLAGI